jgi:hypothetical protein
MSSGRPSTSSATSAAIGGWSIRSNSSMTIAPFDAAR